MKQKLTGAIKKPGCANNLVFMGDMNQLQFARHLYSDQKLTQVVINMRTQDDFKAKARKFLNELLGAK